MAMPESYTIIASERLEIRQSHNYFTVHLKATNKAIGYILLWIDHDLPQIGYRIEEPYRNQGYCTEGLRALLPFVETKYKTLEIDQRNLASLRVAKKCGFTFAGTRDRGWTTYGKTISYGKITSVWMHP